VDIVTNAIGLDSRIGGKYLKGAISYGGPCFPRDNLALTFLARKLGAPADIAETTHNFNCSQVSWLADLVQQNGTPGETIGILGLTYKPHTDVVEQAAGILLAQELAGRGVSVAVFDPAGARSSCVPLTNQVRFAATSKECIALSSVVIVATAWPEFASIPAIEWARHGAPRVVVDCWRALPHLATADGVRYVSLGTGGTAVLDSEELRTISFGLSGW
jgi:UDPglucose 6-dehydrogenase